MGAAAGAAVRSGELHNPHLTGELLFAPVVDVRQLLRLSHFLSAKVFETGAAVERLLAENEALKSRLMSLE